jgi:uncharacterized protein YutE (UPF0331/DUF86 family)
LVDRDLIISKAGSVGRRVERAVEKAGADLDAFLNDPDRQEIVSFNLHLAVENCVDIAAHIISDRGYGVPGSASEMFYILEEKGFLDRDLTEKMVKAAGLRNLIVHEYGRLDVARLYDTVRKDLQDLKSYLAAVFSKLSIK